MAIDQFSRSLPMMLYRCLDTVMPRFRKIFTEFGLTEQQGRVLRVLFEHEKITVNALSELTLIPAPSLVGILGRLEKAGLIRRRRSRTDRRRVYVLATEKGADLGQMIIPAVAAAYAQLKQSVDAETWDGVLRGLQQISQPDVTATDVLPPTDDVVPVALPDL